MSDDPLRHADVGEVKTVRETVDLPTINFSPDVFYKSDRMGEPSVVDVDVIEDEDGYEVVQVAFEGDMVKRIGPYWVSSRMPRTKSERKSHRRKTWISRILKGAVTALPIAVGLGASYYVMQSLEGVTMEPVTFEAPTAVDFLPVVLLVILVYLAVWVMPRMITDGWRVWR